MGVGGEEEVKHEGEEGEVDDHFGTKGDDA